MKRYKIRVAYDGTEYCGWQYQDNGVTIQGELIKACSKIIQGEFSVQGASRTDAGVHALGQIALIKADTRIPEDKMAGALNANLPEDIVVQEAAYADEDFHPINSAKRKTYIYKIHNAPNPLPMLRRYSHYERRELDVKKMQRAAEQFVGTHDFIGFRSVNGYAKTTVRTIYNCRVYEKDELIYIEVTGNGFLYNMVRIIAGTLIYVGLDKIEADAISEIIQTRDRTKAGPVLPPEGLTLVRIEY